MRAALPLFLACAPQGGDPTIRGATDAEAIATVEVLAELRADLAADLRLDVPTVVFEDLAGVVGKAEPDPWLGWTVRVQSGLDDAETRATLRHEFCHLVEFQNGTPFLDDPAWPVVDAMPTRESHSPRAKRAELAADLCALQPEDLQLVAALGSGCVPDGVDAAAEALLDVYYARDLGERVIVPTTKSTSLGRGDKRYQSWIVWQEPADLVFAEWDLITGAEDPMPVAFNVITGAIERPLRGRRLRDDTATLVAAAAVPKGGRFVDDHWRLRPDLDFQVRWGPMRWGDRLAFVVRRTQGVDWVLGACFDDRLYVRSLRHAVVIGVEGQGFDCADISGLFPPSNRDAPMPFGDAPR